VALVDERGDAAERVELLPARRHRGDGEGAEAVDLVALDPAGDAADSCDHAAEVDLV
jgi:hypothetical protein